MGWEFNILNGIQDLFQSGSMDTVMPVITALGNGGLFWIAIGLIFTMKKQTRLMGICMLTAMFFEVLSCNVILKPLIARPRPFTADPSRILLIPAPADYSFPSGHTAVSFAAASAVFSIGKKKLGLVFGIMAVLIAFSRLYLYVHYPTDVLAGMVIGILCGLAASKIVPMIPVPGISSEEQKE